MLFLDEWRSHDMKQPIIMKKKIGILGSGNVGKVLASGFIANGYEVMIGTRDTTKLNEWKTATKGQVGSFEDTARFGDIIILAAKGIIAAEVLRSKGAETLSGKTIIDASNPIAALPPVNGVLQYFTTMNKSLMEMLQEEFPHANFVKAYNSVGNALMVNPDFGGQKPTMFICGNNEAAKLEVMAINSMFGWDSADMGKAEAARAIEPLCMLWCIPAFTQGKSTHAFKLLQK